MTEFNTPPSSDNAAAPSDSGKAPPATTSGGTTDQPAAPPKKPDPKIQEQITPDSIKSTAARRGITEDAVKKELQSFGYTVP